MELRLPAGFAWVTATEHIKEHKVYGKIAAVIKKGEPVIIDVDDDDIKELRLEANYRLYYFDSPESFGMKQSSRKVLSEIELVEISQFLEDLP